MRNTLTIARRELSAYFISPVAYVVIAGFLIIAGYFFTLILFYSREATLRYLFSNLTTILIFVAPVLSMRLLAEEQRSGTIELLLTAPVRDWEVVLGKWTAAFVFWLIMLIPTAVYPILLNRYGDPDIIPIVTGYLGIILLGGTLLALGTLTSAMTQNQIVAAVLGVGLTLLLWLIGAAGDFAGPALSGFFQYLALGTHFSDLARGIVDTKNIVYYLSVTVAALFLATRVLESRRWR
ncbi:MAG: ABC transporter permease subunit [Anaerolineae bacterium]|nr:ABC transporter permease subunit [Anaerolineae bacterium]